MSSRSLGSDFSRSNIRRATPATMASALALGMFWPTGLATSSFAEAKTPGKTYCYHRVCHRVMTLEETRRAIGRPMTLHASHYDDPWRDRFNPRNLTSSGEMFRSGAPDNAASPKLPNGTIVLAWNSATRQAAVLRINNAGPYWRNRTLDVSRAAAERLGFAKNGVAQLKVTVIHAPTAQEATYRKGRRYAAVPGPLGSFASFELASAAAARAIGRPLTPDTIPSSTIAVASAEQPSKPAPAPAASALAPSGAPAIAASATSAEPPVVDVTVIVAQAQSDMAPTSAAAPAGSAAEGPAIGSLGQVAAMTLPPLQPLRLASFASPDTKAAPQANRIRERSAKQRAAKPIRVAALQKKPVTRAVRTPKAAPNTTLARGAAAAVAQSQPSASQRATDRLAQLRRNQAERDDDEGTPQARAPRRQIASTQQAGPVRQSAPSMENIPVECRSWTYRCTLPPSATATPRPPSRTRVASATSSNNE